MSAIPRKRPWRCNAAIVRFVPIASFRDAANSASKRKYSDQFEIHLRNPKLNWSFLACRYQPGLTMLTSNRREFLRGTEAGFVC